MNSPAEALVHENELQNEHAQELNLPIILAGYSGSGKDTVSNSATKVADSMDSRHNFHHSRSRYTDRARRPSEIQGVNGFFVSPEEFDARKEGGEFFYDYQKQAYGGVRYGFSRFILNRELQNRHTFVVGGEIDTSLELKNALDEVAMKARGKMEKTLHPLIVFVNRPMEKIVNGIKMRGASEEEKKKRIAHVEQHWERYPKVLEQAGDQARMIWNVDLDVAARQVIQFVETEVARQMQEIYGSKAAKKK